MRQVLIHPFFCHFVQHFIIPGACVTILGNPTGYPDDVTSWKRGCSSFNFSAANQLTVSKSRQFSSILGVHCGLFLYTDVSVTGSNNQNKMDCKMDQIKANLAGCKYFLLENINLYPSGCSIKPCELLNHGLFGYLASFNSR